MYRTQSEFKNVSFTLSVAIVERSLRNKYADCKNCKGSKAKRTHAKTKQGCSLMCVSTWCSGKSSSTLLT